MGIFKKKKEFAGAIFIDQPYADVGFGIGVKWERDSMKNGTLVFKAGEMVLHFPLEPSQVGIIKLYLEQVNLKPKGRKNRK